MYNFILILHTISSILIIFFILIQGGRTSDLISGMASGSSKSLFGPSGSANFLSRSTKWAAILFFCLTLILAYHNKKLFNSSIMNPSIRIDSIPDAKKLINHDAQILLQDKKSKIN